MNQPVKPGAQLDLTRQSRRSTLVAERVHRDLPAVAALAQQILLRHDDVVEEQLAELGMTGDLGHRPDLDAWGVHVDDQHRDALVPRPVCEDILGPREYPAPARELAPGHPCLLTAESEVVLMFDRAGAKRREVGSRVGLGEALTPDFLRRQDRRDVATTLLVAAEAQERRTEHVEADDVHEFRRARGREFLVDEDLLDRRVPAAAELTRPRAAHVSGLVAAALPAPQCLDPLVERVGKVLRDVLGEELADLVLEPPLGLCHRESHGRESIAELR